MQAIAYEDTHHRKRAAREHASGVEVCCKRADVDEVLVAPGNAGHGPRTDRVRNVAEVSSDDTEALARAREGPRASI